MTFMLDQVCVVRLRLAGLEAHNAAMAATRKPFLKGPGITSVMTLETSPSLPYHVTAEYRKMFKNGQGDSWMYHGSTKHMSEH